MADLMSHFLQRSKVIIDNIEGTRLRRQAQGNQDDNQRKVDHHHPSYRGARQGGDPMLSVCLSS